VLQELQVRLVLHQLVLLQELQELLVLPELLLPSLVLQLVFQLSVRSRQMKLSLRERGK
jgi:hypothetical protein